MITLDQLKWMLAAGRLSRRGFMEGALALGATVAGAEMMMGKALAATPKKGGTLRLGIGHGSTTDSMDPATYENLYMQTLAGSVHNKLTVVGNTGELEPELAESWEASADARQWHIKLRQGVEFHNGKTLEAADVIASINHHRGEESKSAAKPIVDPITNIEADGKDTVVFTLKDGSAD
ncbi:MAG: ABC transporter substrate-binding protein, partial [Paracoccaceae bacterium]